MQATSHIRSSPVRSALPTSVSICLSMDAFAIKAQYCADVYLAAKNGGLVVCELTAATRRVRSSVDLPAESFHQMAKNIAAFALELGATAAAAGKVEPCFHTKPVHNELFMSYQTTLVPQQECRHTILIELQHSDESVENCRFAIAKEATTLDAQQQVCRLCIILLELMPHTLALTSTESEYCELVVGWLVNATDGTIENLGPTFDRACETLASFCCKIKPSLQKQEQLHLIDAQLSLLLSWTRLNRSLLLSLAVLSVVRRSFVEDQGSGGGGGGGGGGGDDDSKDSGSASPADKPANVDAAPSA